MTQDADNDTPRRPRGRPRKHYNIRTMGLPLDVDAMLIHTSEQTMLPINMIVAAILRGYFVQRGKMRHILPPTPDPDGEALGVVPITPMYELSEQNTTPTAATVGVERDKVT